MIDDQHQEAIKFLLQAFAKAGLDPDRYPAQKVVDILSQLQAEKFECYTPHKKQRLFHEAGASAKQRLFMGGNRTGKTYCGVIEVAMHLTGNYPSWWRGYKFCHPVNVWAASNTGDSTKSILQEEGYVGSEGIHEGALPKHLITRTSRKPGVADAVDTVYIKHSTGGISTLTFKSFDQGRLKFQGTKKHIIHFDEEPPYPVYTEALLRTMSVGGHYGMILVTMSPLMGMSEMVSQFILNQTVEVVQNNKFYVQASWSDNPYLSKEERGVILKSLKPHEREAREKGIPSYGAGLVYPIPADNIFITPIEIPSHWKRFYAIDFGWTNPTAVLFGAYDLDNDMLYFIGEYSNAELTPEQHATYLLKRGCNWMPGVYDPAGAISSQKDGEQLVGLYQKAGLLYLSKADNAKEAGIQATLQLMRNGQLKIFNTCVKTRNEYITYARNMKGIPNKSNDHLMDCLRYGVMSGKCIARSKLESSINQQWSNTPTHWMT